MLRKLFVPLALLAACQAPGAEAPMARKSGASSTSASGRPLDLMGGGAEACAGEVVTRGGERFLRLEDGSLLTRAPLAVRAEGGPRTFHPDNFAGGAVQHRCNAGEVHLPNGTRYMGGRSEASCERFERDAARIEARPFQLEHPETVPGGSPRNELAQRLGHALQLVHSRGIGRQILRNGIGGGEEHRHVLRPDLRYGGNRAARDEIEELQQLLEEQ